MKRETLPTVVGSFAAALIVLACAGKGQVQSAPAEPALDAVLPDTVLFDSFPEIEGPQGDHLRFLAVGDTGEPPTARGSNYSATVEAMGVIANTDALLLLGDNVYGCGLRGQEDPGWQRQIDPLLALGLPIYPVLGNHDYGKKAHPRCRFSNPEAQVEQSGQAGYERWIFPAESYVVRTAVVEVIFFDSSPIAYGWKEGESIVAGLTEALEKPKETPWRIVVAHHPLRSCGQHGEQPKTINVRQAVEPLLGNVDLYLAGHDHGLEIHPRKENQPLYIISGGGSKVRTRTICSHDDYKLIGGFFLLDVTADVLEVQARCNGEAEPCMTQTLAQRAPPSPASSSEP